MIGQRLTGLKIGKHLAFMFAVELNITDYSSRQHSPTCAARYTA